MANIDNSNNLDKIKNKINKLDGNGKVRFRDIFTAEFMENNTDFNSINQMFKQSDFEIRNEEDFNNLDENKLNCYVAENTDFSDWDEMTEKAISEWVKKELKF